MSGQPDRPVPKSGDESTETEVTDDTPAAADDDVESVMAAIQAKADENWDLYLRASAEVENVRKRASRDVEHARNFALEGFGKELLAVKDSLELGLEATDSADADSLRAGAEATLKLLTGALARFGVEEVDPEGEPFDPERHEAISMQPSADLEPGSIVTVIQKGYALNGRLLRPARVIVAMEVPEETTGD
ncbi:MAG: nucleotide exchange factor GrpE [Proteobacteria bacterium]|nr:nucleotide exchange factor GrpE [Pseudomonadota bacterium]